MAPEQARGKKVDKRADIWSWGVLFYELLTGERMFKDGSVADTLAQVLTKEPDLERVPARVRKLLGRCLKKDPKQRLRDIGEARFLLEEGVGRAISLPAVQQPSVGQHRVSARSRLGTWVPWTVAALSAAIAAVILWLQHSSVQPRGEAFRLFINPPDRAAFSSSYPTSISVPQFALSPDGRAIALVASGAKAMLWRRNMDDIRAVPLAGTEGADAPFWSADGRSLGFFANGKLKRVPSSGGLVQELATVPDPRGGTWGPDDTILFGTATDSIFRIPAAGGRPTPVTKVDSGEGSHRFPQFLPGGRNFLFTVRSDRPEKRGIYIGSLDGKAKKSILAGIDSSAAYATPGYLLYLEGTTLVERAFDRKRLDVSGQQFTVVEDQIGRAGTSQSAFSASSAGTLAYASALSQPGRLTWFDRRGIEGQTVGPEGDYVDFRLSPDDAWLADSLIDPRTGSAFLWLTEMASGRRSRLFVGSSGYSGGNTSAGAMWSYDLNWIFFRTNQTGKTNEFYKISAHGAGKEEPVMLTDAQRAAGVTTGNASSCDLSPDGQNMIFVAGDSSAFHHLWILPLVGAKQAYKYLDSSSNEMHASFSPDGRYVAYSSDESGQFEVYVRTFPRTDQRWTVSLKGGDEPRWGRNGREIYYLASDRKLMAAAVNPGSASPFAPPHVLFQTRVPMGPPNPLRTHYVPAADGQRFLINTQTGEAMPTPITIVLNWMVGPNK
jgi:Tol biopolymer transport system component